MWTQNNYTHQTRTIENTNQNCNLMKRTTWNASLALAGLRVGHFLHFVPKLQRVTPRHASNNHCVVAIVRKTPPCND
jgi:hypothetical protein